MRTGGSKSDAELREAVIAGWHRLETEVRSNNDRLAGLVELTGIPFRDLDLVRRVRNRIAHPDEPVPRERLLAALRILADAEQRLAARKQKQKQRRPTNKAAGSRRKPAQRGAVKRAKPRRPQPAPRRGRKAGTVTIAVVVLIAVAVAAAVLLLG